MNRNDIKEILQTGNRASLPPDRKEALRARLVEQIHAESKSLSESEVQVSPYDLDQRQPKRRVIRTNRHYLYPVAGIIAAAGMASVVAVTFGIGSHGNQPGANNRSGQDYSSSSSSSTSSTATSSTASSATSGNSSSSSATSSQADAPIANSTVGSNESNQHVDQHTNNQSVASGQKQKQIQEQTQTQAQNRASDAKKSSTGPVSEGSNHKSSAVNGLASSGSTANSAVTPSAQTNKRNQQTNGAMQSSNALMQPASFIRTMAMTNSTSGWSFTSDGHILHTTNQGTTWTDVTPSGYALSANGNNSGTPVHDSHGETMIFAPTRPSTSTSTPIYTTVNNGASWNDGLLAISGGGSVLQVQMVDARTGFALVQSSNKSKGSILYRTDDSGRTWQPVPQQQSGASVTFTKIEFTSSFIGWGLTESSDGSHAIVTTSDGGQSWHTFAGSLHVPSQLSQSQVDFETLPVFFGRNGSWSVYFKNAQGGLTDVIVYTTVNGGTTWQTGTPVAIQAVSKISFPSPSVGWIVDTHQAAFHETTDGGRTWHTVPIPANMRTSSTQFNFVDASHGFAMVTSNQSSSMLMTTDAAKTWSPEPTKVN